MEEQTIQGRYDSTGVQHLRVPGQAPIHVFYPAETPTDPQPAGLFRQGMHDAALAHLHRAVPKAFRIDQPFHFLLSGLVRPLTWFAEKKRIPSCHVGAVVKGSESAEPQKFPLIIFSHGLTGTGEEHSVLFNNLARQGFIVVCLHHCDGSSVRVQLHSGDIVLYDDPNRHDEVDPMMRSKQLDHREQEILAALDFVTSGEECPAQIRAAVDPSRVGIAGFSFGATTAALCAAEHPDKFRSCLFLDGWFNINFDELKNCPRTGNMNMPAAAFEKGISIPTISIGSSQFRGYTLISKSTDELLAKCVGPVGPDGEPSTARHIVLPNTTHSSCMELFLWLPAFLHGSNAYPDNPGPTYLDLQHKIIDYFSFTLL